jgi:hypothetical protein
VKSEVLPCHLEDLRLLNDFTVPKIDSLRELSPGEKQNFSGNTELEDYPAYPV